MPTTAAVGLRPDAPAANDLAAILRPRSIAVIGASRKRHSIGGELFHNLVNGDFAGAVYPVNANGGSVQGVRAYRSVLDIPDDVDLAIVAIPAEYVADAARECATKGARGLIVVSAGFSETGERGTRLQDELVQTCREHGIRLVGPNCMGVANTAPDVRMNGQFAPIAPLPGRLGVLAQSGALGLALIHEAGRLGLGLSSFVSVGNQADIATDDLLAYWQDDPQTDVILLYLESIADPRRFARIARRVARTKPIIVVKSGRTGAGARATSSHTGALLGASDITVDALFGQAGVIRTDTLAEMFDAAAVLASQPVPPSNRVAVLTNGGGPGILAADAADAAGLELPVLGDETRHRLAALLPGAAAVANPVDMVASATPSDYAAAIEIIGADPAIDSLIVISGPPLATPASVLAGAVHAAVARLPRRLSVATVFMSTEQPRTALSGEGLTIPSYLYPENAAYALGHAVRYGAWRAAPAGRVREFIDICVDDFKPRVDGESRWLGPNEVRRLLTCYGLPVVEEGFVTSVDEARQIAATMTGPFALKGVSTAVVHKSEARGVRLDLATPVDVEQAASEMTADYAAAGHAIEGFVVQPMVPSGLELLVGVVHDRLFGPVVACAIGGTQTELLKDVSVRITPLTDVDAAQMVRSLATYPLLDGYRGAPPLDVAALEEVLLRVSALVEAHPEIAEMDLNPVIVLPRGAVIVDARIRVEAGA